MERLTERGEEMGCPGIWVKEGYVHEGIKTFFEGYDEGYYAIEKLANYEDAEEQGLLMQLQCKPGEKVYCIEEYEDGCEYVCYLFIAVCKDFVIVSSRYTHCDNINEQLEEMCVDSQEYDGVDFYLFPRNKVFLTKAEAEAALERMK